MTSDKGYTYELQQLASACGRGDNAAMLEISEYLRETMPDYDKGADMWLLRAAIYGNSAAQERVLEEIKKNPHFLEKSMIPYENFLPGRRDSWHSGYYSGDLLNKVGLLAFQPGENYLLAGISEDRTMLIWQEDDYDPADEDGFGAETYYNMFYLDEFFQPLPGVPMLHSVSDRDIRCLKRPKQQFEAMTLAMQEHAVKRRRFPLWTEFVPEGK